MLNKEGARKRENASYMEGMTTGNALYRGA